MPPSCCSGGRERKLRPYSSHLEGRGKVHGRESCSLLVFGYCTNPYCFFAHFSIYWTVFTGKKCGKLISMSVSCTSVLYSSDVLSIQYPSQKPNLISAPVEIRHCVPAWKKPTPPRHQSFDFVTLSRYHRNYTLTDPTDVGPQLIKYIAKQEY